MTQPMHRDFEPFELGDNMEEDLGLFEAATHARRFDVAPLVVRHVLAVSGGAAPGVMPAARGLATRLSATLVEDTTADSADAMLAAAARLGAAVVVASAALPESVVAGLVAPQPADPAVPIVLVPEAPSFAAAALDTLVLPLFTDAPATRRACEWACGLAAAAGPQGVIHALELASTDTRRAARRSRRGAAAPGDATVGRTVAGGLGSIIAGLQRDATRHGFAVEVTFRGGRPGAELLAVVRGLGRPATAVLGRDDAPAVQSPAAQLALDLVRSRAAVTLVA